MSDIFISYASEDREEARRLAKALEAQGWSVWWDRTIPAGKTFVEVIEEALAAARCVVVAWSATSTTKNWVLEEAQEGLDRGILVPVFIEQVTPPRGFRRIQAADLSDWEGSEDAPAFRQFVGDLAGILGPPPRQVGRKTDPKPRKPADSAREAEMQLQRREAQRKTNAEGRPQGRDPRDIEEDRRRPSGSPELVAEGRDARSKAPDAARKNKFVRLVVIAVVLLVTALSALVVMERWASQRAKSEQIAEVRRQAQEQLDETRRLQQEEERKAVLETRLRREAEAERARRAAEAATQKKAAEDQARAREQLAPKSAADGDRAKPAVPPALLGVQVQGVTRETAESMGLDRPRGALVAGIREGSPAARAGVQVGDVILEFNRQKIEGARDLAQLVSRVAPGTSALLVIRRKTKTMFVAVTLASRK